MDYAERIQAQSNSNTWAEQMDKEIFQPTPLSYTSAEEGTSSTTNTEFGSGNIHDPHANITANMCDPQSLEPSVVIHHPLRGQSTCRPIVVGWQLLSDLPLRNEQISGRGFQKYHLFIT